MVRVKHRYLLVNILYPELEQQTPASKVPNIVTFHQPTSDALTSQVLLRAIRAEVNNLFGDFGSGVISDIKYLSAATSTFILKVSRAHYNIVWAALSFMNRVPIKNGKNCVFRVIRVSGTIRKAEEEAIRRARETIVKARRELDGQSVSTLDSILGKEGSQSAHNSLNDVNMVDRSDSEEDDEDLSDG
ncbi:Rpp14 family protein [Phlyctema vagabunda]|uniref:Rpp14 family protein n=1 Tax=Phlyctema vagabunda TaxID=108571 RepID=A0ABR4PW19_9HELO